VVLKVFWTILGGVAPFIVILDSGQPEKASALISPKVAGSVRLVRGQLENAYESIKTRPSSKATLLMPVEEKAYLPITPTLEGTIKLVRPLQESNALGPTPVTPEGIVKLPENPEGAPTMVSPSLL
jgi:hypothetical protein